MENIESFSFLGFTVYLTFPPFGAQQRFRDNSSFANVEIAFRNSQNRNILETCSHRNVGLGGTLWSGLGRRNVRIALERREVMNETKWRIVGPQEGSG